MKTAAAILVLALVLLAYELSGLSWYSPHHNLFGTQKTWNRRRHSRGKK